MALIVPLHGLQTNKPRCSTALIRPLQAVAQEHGAQPFTLELRADGEGGQVPGVLAAGSAEEAGLDVVDDAGEGVAGVLVKVRDGEEPVTEGEDGLHDRGDPGVYGVG